METRFGLKDFFLFALIILLIGVVVLAMWQFDRQWKTIQIIHQQNENLAGDIQRINSRLAQGNFSTAPAGGTNTGPSDTVTLQGGVGRDGATDPFYLVKEAQQQEGYARGGWIIDNFGTKIGKLTPLISTDVYQAWVEGQVVEAMAMRDPYSLELVPRLARGWEISEDGLEVIFHLRPGVVFSDGEPLTADDVVFTFDFIRNPEINAPRTRAYLDKLDEVEKIDDYTVRATFTEPYFLNFETVAGMGILPKHFYEQFTPNEFNESVGLLMGSGPYKLEDPKNWRPGDGVTLVRNPRYWGEPPAPERIVFLEVQEETAAEVMFKNQQLDRLSPPPEQFDKLKNDPEVLKYANAYVYTSPYGGYNYIGWNHANPLFADKRVRRALTMLLDRDRLAQELYRGYATPASGPFASDSPQSNPDIQPVPYDPEAARKLLAEAGFEDRNGDGVLENEQGKPLSFTLSYPSGSQFYEKIIRFLRDGFARGGVLMEPEALDFPVLLTRLDQRKFQAVTLGWSGSIESDPYQIFHSDQLKDGGDNVIGYSNPELDALIEKARTTMDTEERMKLWHEVHAILAEDQPYTFLLNRKATRLMNKRIRNVETSRIGLNFEFSNGGFIPWFIPTAEQTHSR